MFLKYALQKKAKKKNKNEWYVRNEEFDGIYRKSSRKT